MLLYYEVSLINIMITQKNSQEKHNMSHIKNKSLTDSALNQIFKSSSSQRMQNKHCSNTNSNQSKGREKAKNNSERRKPPIGKLSKGALNNKPQTNIPCRKRNKQMINTTRPLTTEITLSFNCFNETKEKRPNSLNHPLNKTSSFLEIQDELLELKLLNSKMKNDITILNDKIKSLEGIIAIKTKEKEQMKNNYEQLLLNVKNEVLKENKTQIDQLLDNYNAVLCSVLSLLIDVCEVFLIKNNSNNNSNTNVNGKNIRTIQIENSVDVFDSFNNDQDKRSSLLDQIQGLLLGKMSYIKRVLELPLEKEIEKVLNWSTMSTNINLSMNGISPLKANEDIFNSISKVYFNSISTLNDFDLSVSGHFFAQSPKFNSNINKEAENTNYCYSHRTTPDYPIQTVLQQIIPAKTGGLISHLKISNNNGNDKKEQLDDSPLQFNDLECSIRDLISQSKIAEGWLNLEENKELKENMSFG